MSVTAWNVSILTLNFYINTSNCLVFGSLYRLDLPSSMTELSLDYNKISKVEVEDFIRYKNLQRWKQAPFSSVSFMCFKLNNMSEKTV